MAELKQLEPDNLTNTISSKVDKLEEQRKKQKKVQEIDSRIDSIATKAADFEERYGMDDFRTQMICTLLDTTLQMRDMMEFMRTFQDTMEFFGIFTNFMDESLDLENQVNMAAVKQEMSQGDGFFKRAQAQRDLDKKMKAFENHMKYSMQMIQDQFKMQQQITKEVQKMMGSMNQSMKAMKANTNTKGNSEGSFALSPETQKLIEAKKSQKTGKSGGSSTAPSGGKPSTDASSIDDITF